MISKAKAPTKDRAAKKVNGWTVFAALLCATKVDPQTKAQSKSKKDARNCFLFIFGFKIYYIYFLLYYI